MSRASRLPAAARRSQPWKNGGGLTQEVAASPAGAGLDDFDWRISLAEVRAGGPFSLFPGVDRRLAVLEGRLSLEIAGRPPVHLSPEEPLVSFPGDVPAQAALAGRPVRDLNVMTRRATHSSELELRRGPDRAQIAISRGTSFVVALDQMELSGPDWRVELGALDAARIEAEAEEILRAAPSAAGFCLIRIRALRPG